VFFDTWYGLARPVVVGAAAYVGLIVLLRATGKRTLSKLNAFDLVVTVALGSTLATVLLTKDVALAEGLVGFAVLILLQLVVTGLSTRSAAVRRLVRSDPALLYYRGAFLPAALRAERVTESEVLQAVRSSGQGSLEHVEAVVLESDGSLSVVTGGAGSALKDVPGGSGAGAGAGPARWQESPAHLTG
jgi:uncharacterized membrane protein YcaP (DUF421 family)